ncbi:molybdenum cofactor guanylyltransferase [Paenibacillus sp. CAU 1782]
MPHLNGLILAGGRSSRMGRDKALLPIDGEPLLLRLVKQIAPHVQVLAIACGSREKEALYREALQPWLNSPEGLPNDGDVNGDGPHDRPGELRMSTPSILFVADSYPGEGPLAGLHGGLEQLPGGYVFVTACDSPDVSLSLLAAQEEASGSGADVVCLPGQPFHGLYHTRVAEAAKAALERGERRVMSLLSELRVVSPQLELPQHSPVNLNTPEEYEAYLKERLEGRKP